MRLLSFSSKPDDIQGMSTDDIAIRYVTAIHDIAELHQPSRYPFFKRLRGLPAAVARDPVMLGQIHLVYQAAMHATRAAVYFLPHLDNPEMRKRKLQIFIDDDGLPGGDTHHYQLTGAFERMGANLLLTDEEFGDADALSGHLDPATSRFVRLATKLYARSLGPWCVVELMSDTWMHSLADSLAVHFPAIVKEPYFADCFSQGVEERHAEEALAVTGQILRDRPDLWSETVNDAKLMAEALDGVWNRLDDIVRMAEQEHTMPNASELVSESV
jgi:pyrroloquinoline quinone (PQQ) biosynthesis protein C